MRLSFQINNAYPPFFLDVGVATSVLIKTDYTPKNIWMVSDILHFITRSFDIVDLFFSICSNFFFSFCVLVIVINLNWHTYIFFNVWMHCSSLFFYDLCFKCSCVTTLNGRFSILYFLSNCLNSLVCVIRRVCFWINCLVFIVNWCVFFRCFFFFLIKNFVLNNFLWRFDHLFTTVIDVMVVVFVKWDTIDCMMFVVNLLNVL